MANSDKPTNPQPQKPSNFPDRTGHRGATLPPKR